MTDLTCLHHCLCLAINLSAYKNTDSSASSAFHCLCSVLIPPTLACKEELASDAGDPSIGLSFFVWGVSEISWRLFWPDSLLLLPLNDLWPGLQPLPYPFWWKLLLPEKRWNCGGIAQNWPQRIKSKSEIGFFDRSKTKLETLSQKL